MNCETTSRLHAHHEAHRLPLVSLKPETLLCWGCPPNLLLGNLFQLIIKAKDTVWDGSFKSISACLLNNIYNSLGETSYVTVPRIYEFSVITGQCQFLTLSTM